MGMYINPVGESKESWLEREALPADSVPTKIDEIDGFLPICLVNNGLFCAAAVVYSNRELMAFDDPNDYRQKWWFFAPIETLVEVCPDLTRFLVNG